jgi:hypothetical protein
MQTIGSGFTVVLFTAALIFYPAVGYQWMFHLQYCTHIYPILSQPHSWWVLMQTREWCVCGAVQVTFRHYLGVPLAASPALRASFPQGVPGLVCHGVHDELHLLVAEQP